MYTQLITVAFLAVTTGMTALQQTAEFQSKKAEVTAVEQAAVKDVGDAKVDIPADPPTEPGNPADYKVGDIVMVAHHVSVTASSGEEIDSLPTHSFTVGWLVQTEPENIIALTRWPNEQETKYYNNKRFPDEMIITVRLVEAID